MSIQKYEPEIQVTQKLQHGIDAETFAKFALLTPMWADYIEQDGVNAYYTHAKELSDITCCIVGNTWRHTLNNEEERWRHDCRTCAIFSGYWTNHSHMLGTGFLKGAQEWYRLIPEFVRHCEDAHPRLFGK